MEAKEIVGIIKKELDSVAGKLRTLGAQKEIWYKKATELKKLLKEQISKIKILKSKKDVSNEKVKEYKEERDKYNNKVKELIKQIRELNTEKRELTKKYGIKFDPSILKSKIEQLEMRIQTEAPSFEREKKIMGEIKKLKNLYNESGAVKEVVDKINNLSKDIDDAREKGEDYHKKLKEHFKESKDYKEFIELSQQIDELKRQQENAFNTFKLLKKEYDELSRRAGVARQEKIKKKAIHEEKKKQAEEKLIDEKVKQVEEKLKIEKKLTTADLIAYQGKKE